MHYYLSSQHTEVYLHGKLLALIIHHSFPVSTFQPRESENQYSCSTELTNILGTPILSSNKIKNSKWYLNADGLLHLQFEAEGEDYEQELEIQCTLLMARTECLPVLWAIWQIKIKKKIHLFSKIMAFWWFIQRLSHKHASYVLLPQYQQLWISHDCW